MSGDVYESLGKSMNASGNLCMSPDVMEFQGYQGYLLISVL